MGAGVPPGRAQDEVVGEIKAPRKGERDQMKRMILTAMLAAVAVVAQAQSGTASAAPQTSTKAQTTKKHKSSQKPSAKKQKSGATSTPSK